MATENRYMIMGYNVDFPPGKRPFPAQFAVMNKVLTALKTEQHALLESPTGSGKTLALLCSSLTFQRQHFKESVATRQQQLQDPEYQAQLATKQAQMAQLKVIEAQMQLLEAQQQVEMARKARQPANIKEECSTDSTWPTQSTQATQETRQDNVASTQESRNTSNWMSTRKRALESDVGSLEAKRVLPPSFAKAVQEAKVAKTLSAPLDATKPICIFFCSRTHSQLAQVIEELKTCPMSYFAADKDPLPSLFHLQTCVLGSKRNLCVNRKYNRDPLQVDEKCRVALETSSCSFFRKRKKVNDLQRVVPSIWDIEDLVALAQTHRECAYFHARETVASANIVFAPYNYLLDPTIRNAVGIRVKDAIIVLDEAHNVEETCRASASVEVTHDVLTTSIKAFELVLAHGQRPEWYNPLLKVLYGLNRWLHSIDAPGVDEPSKVWSGVDALAMLAEYAGISRETFSAIQKCVDLVREYEMEVSNEVATKDADGPATVLLGAVAFTTVQSLVNVVESMLRDDSKFLDDFQLVVLKTKGTVAPLPSPTKRRDTDLWDVKVCIWCLNAAVAFSDLATQARSVILTSGTLGPLASFAGELGVEFPIRLEANHVVNMRKQVLVGAIMHGPGNVDLQSTYQNQQDPRYQDSMGQLLVDYAHAIPGGILMFFPSYALLTKLTRRWKKTNVWQEMEQRKALFVEPRFSGKDFDALLGAYKDTVAKCTHQAGTKGQSKQTGAVFLAVYRGKVSEGIDFSNDNARAVLCVGIPFPSVKELQVALKRKYQDEKSRVNVQLVNGNGWYQLQAFRALNQALGRCIRHCQDYGAILLLDSRHRGHKHSHALSKWMRPYIQEFEHSRTCVPMFKEFFHRNAMELPTMHLSLEKNTLSNEQEKPPLVLEYEQGSETKKKRLMPSSPTTTVKEETTQKEQEAADPSTGVFSIFRPQSCQSSRCHNKIDNVST